MLQKRKQKTEQDYVYVSLNQFGQYDVMTEAKLNFTKTLPIIMKPDDYKMAVYSFALRSAYIPTFICPEEGFSDLYRVAVIAGDLGKLVQTNPAHPNISYPYALNDISQVVEIWPGNSARQWAIQNEQKEEGAKRASITGALYSYEQIFGDINDAIFHSGKALEAHSLTFPNGVPAIGPQEPGIDIPWISCDEAKTSLNFTTYYVPELFEYTNPDPNGNDSACALFLCVSKLVARKMTFPWFPIDAFNIQPGQNFTGIDEEFKRGRDSDLVFLDISSIWASSACSTLNTYSKYVQRAFTDNPSILTSFQPTKVDYLRAGEIESALDQWNTCVKIFFRSNLPIFTPELSGQQAVKDNILQDYDVTGLMSRNASTANVVLDNPIFYSVSQGSSLSQISVSAHWVDFNGNARPVYLSGNDSFSMKLQFNKIRDKKEINNQTEKKFRPTIMY